MVHIPYLDINRVWYMAPSFMVFVLIKMFFLPASKEPKYRMFRVSIPRIVVVIS